MFPTNRRRFLSAAATGVAGLSLDRLLVPLVADDDTGASRAGDLQIATFRFDVTPPKGHSLCGGWIKPVVGYDDALEAIGLVILGAGKPIVLCAVDWTGILNSGHLAWREGLAAAAGTTADRVAVQCVHQHNAPFACPDAEKIVAAQGDLPHILELDFFFRCLEQGRKAVATAVEQAVPLTHVATSQAKVEKVASNRRFVGPDGKIEHWRGSSSRNPLHKELPEGLIDPWLKTVAFYSGEQKVAACHYYATHPMSYYGDGRVSSDFAGLARKRRQKEQPDCTYIYFTGCAGNVAAGKYNDGSKQARTALTDRMYAALVNSEQGLERLPIESMTWRTANILPEPHDSLDAEKLLATIGDKSGAVRNRNRPAYRLAWLQRCERGQPIVLSALHVNQTVLLHLPAESFVEYQLRAQQLAGKNFVATAAYGDGGPWYIPTRESYPQGGYEVSVAFSDPEVDSLLAQGTQTLLGRS